MIIQPSVVQLCIEHNYYKWLIAHSILLILSSLAAETCDNI